MTPPKLAPVAVSSRFCDGGCHRTRALRGGRWNAPQRFFEPKTSAMIGDRGVKVGHDRCPVDRSAAGASIQLGHDPGEPLEVLPVGGTRLGSASLGPWLEHDPPSQTATATPIPEQLRIKVPTPDEATDSFPIDGDRAG